MAAAGDRATFLLLSQTFLEHAPPLAERLHDGLRRQDATVVASASHALKGMAMLIGATQLCAQLQHIENTARQYHALPLHQPSLHALLERVLSEVRTSMDAPAA